MISSASVMSALTKPEVPIAKDAEA